MHFVEIVPNLAFFCSLFSGYSNARKTLWSLALEGLFSSI
jgi:hypothetical protein